MLENPTININDEEKESGCNAFWIASFYGRGNAMGLLANSGINILCKHKFT